MEPEPHYCQIHLLELALKNFEPLLTFDLYCLVTSWKCLVLAITFWNKDKKKLTLSLNGMTSYFIHASVSLNNHFSIFHSNKLIPVYIVEVTVQSNRRWQII